MRERSFVSAKLRSIWLLFPEEVVSRALPADRIPGSG
jgi:hypothetical protein